MDPIKWEQDQEAKRALAEEENENEPVDELDEDGEEVEEDIEKPKAKKRKRESEKKQKPKEPKDSSKSKSKRKKSNAMVESEDEGGDAGPSSKSAPPASKRSKHSKDVKEANGEGKNRPAQCLFSVADTSPVELENDPEANKVKDMRHKLQRAFLSKTGPKPEVCFSFAEGLAVDSRHDLQDMSALDKLFNEVEEYGMTIQYLQVRDFLHNVFPLPILCFDDVFIPKTDYCLSFSSTRK